MSELMEKIQEALWLHTDSFSTTDETDYDLEAAKALIIAAFKAHIEGCEKPFIPLVGNKSVTNRRSFQIGFCEGREADRKALIESLE